MNLLFRFLNGNKISWVCGLESAECLEELHVAGQHLPVGTNLRFDEASIHGIKDSLRVLNASDNGMTEDDMETLLDLHRLQKLSLANNQLKNM
ncbi:unnamed protein product, partial [Choristocarpus tenellus]